MAESFPRHEHWRAQALTLTVLACVVVGISVLSMLPCLTGLAASPSGGQVVTLRRVQTPLRFWLVLALSRLGFQTCLLAMILLISLVAGSTRQPFPVRRSWYQEIFGGMESWGVWALAVIGLCILGLWIRQVYLTLQLTHHGGALELPGHGWVEQPLRFWLVTAGRLLGLALAGVAVAILVW